MDLFLPVSGMIGHSPFKKVRRQPILIVSFSSILRSLRDSQNKKIELKSERCRTLPGEFAGDSVTK